MKKLFKFLIAVFLGFSLVSCVRTADSVTLNKETLTLEVGQSETLTATVAPEKLSDLELVWATSDLNVAEVVNGKVTAKKAGTATITVYAHYGEESEKKDTCTVTVKDKVIAVTGVTFHADTDSVYMGSTLQMTAVVAPSNATNKAVTWKSSNEAVATVDGNGLVTPVKTGTTTITVTTVDGSKTDTCEVTVLQLATGIVLDKETHTLNTDDSVTLVATVAPANANDKTVTWKSSDVTVATVENGVVTALKAGTATITVTTNNGSKTASCTITVNQLVTEITLSEDELELNVGDEETLVAAVTPLDATDKEVTWASSNEEVATVVDGKVTAVAKGEATITVSAKDGSDVEATCTVTVLQPVTGVSFAQTSGSVVEGETKQLAAVVAPANASNTNVTWTSEDEEIATVDENGLVTGVAVGTTTITVTTVDGNKTATYTITVVADAIPTESITVSAPNNETEIKVDGNLQLTATVTPEDTTDSLTWSSSDETVATVSVAGLVTAKKAGNVTITATSGSKSATYDLEVVKHDNSIANIETITVTYGDTYNVTVGTPVYGTPVVVYLADGSSVPLLEKPTNAGTYSVVVNITGNDKYNDFTKVVGTIVINKKAIAKPAQDTTNFVYTGEELTYTVAENAGYTVSNNTTQTNAGSYDVVITLDSNYVWADETTDALTYKFVIARTNPTLTVEDLEVELGDEIEVVYQTNSDGKVTIKFYQGNNEVTPDAAGTYKVVVTVAQATNYNAITAEAELVVVISTTSLEVDKTTVNLEVIAEETVTITRLPQDSTDELTISSTDEEIAKIQNGKVVAGKKAGTATITITSGEFTKTITVTVTNPWGTATDPITVDEAITLLGRYDALKTFSPVVAYVIGEVESITPYYENYNVFLVDGSDTIQFELFKVNTETGVNLPVVGDTVVVSGYLVNWSETLYEFTKSGNVSPKIIKTIRPSFDITTNIIDTEENPTTSVTINDLEDKATIDTTVEFTITNENTYNLIVTANGVELTPVEGVYSFVITEATTIQVLVVEGEVPATAITIVGDTRVSVDLTLTLTVEKEPWYSTDEITWDSSDETVATVSGGIVTPLKTGTVTVTATSKSGETDTHEVEIYNRWGTAESPITVETALEQIDTLNGSISILGYVTGVVSSEPTTNSRGNYIFKIVNIDTLTSSTPFDVYGAVSATKPEIGDTVVVSGYYKKYNSTYEITYGATDCVLESITHNEYDYTVSYLDAEGATFEGDAQVVGLGAKLTSGTNSTFTITVPTGYAVSEVEFNGNTIIPNGSGEYTITPALENTITITVEQLVVITSITLDKETASIYAGSTIQLNATIEPETATIRTLAWSSSNEAVATVDNTGLVKALTTGETTITAKAMDGSNVQDSCVVTVLESSSHSFTFSSYTAGTQYASGEEHKLDDVVTIYTTECHFTSELRIYSSETHNGYAVSNNLRRNIISMSINAGNKVDVLNVYGSTDGTEWTLVKGVSITSTSYLDYTVDFSGTAYTYFKLDVAGKEQVRIKSLSLVLGPVLEAGNEVTSIELDKSTATINVDGSVTLTATPNEGAFLDDAVWSIVDEKDCVVIEGSGSNCTVTGLSLGTATIKVTCNNVEATCDVTVALAVSIIKNATVNVGEETTITVIPNPTNAELTNVLWTKGNENINIVPNGSSCIVTGVTEGTSTVSFTCDGITETLMCNITVFAAGEVAQTTISKTIAEYAAANGWVDATKYGTLEMDENITITIGNVGQNSSKYYDNGNDWRMYQTESPTIDFTALNGKTIISVKVTYTVSKTGVLTLDGSQVASGSLVEVNASTISFGVGNTGSATNGQVRITQIEVVYQ